MDELEKQFTFLDQLVPKNQTPRIQKITQDLNEICKAAILKQCLINSFEGMKLSKVGVIDTEMLQNILTIKMTNPSFTATQIAQNISFLLIYLYENPQILPSLLKQIQSQTQLFQRVSTFIIPSIFGFFASRDHIIFALMFYQEVIRIFPNHDDATIILAPFFNNGLLFRFFEKVHSVFFQQLTLAFSVGYNTNEDGHIYAGLALYLIECLTSSLDLIPSSVLSLLFFMRDNGWTLHDISTFILNHCFLHHCILFSRTLGTNFTSILCQVVKAVPMQIKSLDAFREALFHSTPLFDAPPIFQPNESYQIQCLVKVSDICFLIKLLSQKNLLSKTISISDFHDYELLGNTWLWIKAYLSSWVNQGSISNLLIFPPESLASPNEPSDPQISKTYQNLISLAKRKTELNPVRYAIDHAGIKKTIILREAIRLLSIDARKFEHEIELKLLLQWQQKWVELLDENICKLIGPEIVKIHKQSFSKLTPSQILIQFSSFCVNRQVKQYLILNNLENLYNATIENHSNKIQEIASMYNSTLFTNSPSKLSEKSNNFDGLQLSLIMDVSSLIRRIQDTSFPNLFSSFMELQQIFHLILHDTPLEYEGIKASLMQIHPIMIIKPFIVFSSIVMRNISFRRLLTSDELKKWNELERVLLTFFKQEPTAFTFLIQENECMYEDCRKVTTEKNSLPKTN